MSRITINLSKKDAELKLLIKELGELDSEENRYKGRSESDIARLILEPALRKVHEKHVQKKSRKVG